MKKYIGIMIIILVINVSIIYIMKRNNYGLLESNINTPVSSNTARWNVLVNSKSLNDYGTIKLTNFTFKPNPHTSENVIAPGSKATVNIEIDPTNTNVAIKYVIEYVDRSSNPNCILNITNISSSGVSLIKTAENAYTGVITIDKIQNHEISTILIDVEWINDEDNNYNDTQIGLKEKDALFIELSLKATQYLGEEIIPY